MTPQQWNRVQDLFESAQAVALPAREEFLRRECSGDDVVLVEVRSLLEAQPATRSYLETPAIELGTMFPQAVAAQADLLDPMIGRELASYTIHRRLGTGGMGVVYLATQRSPKRTVALKLIRPGLASPSLLRRFEHEAQALGRLKHPGIAQIYESGTAQTPLGLQPFFAMEYVAGQPLLEYAGQRSLGTRERLELVASLCDAVQHAHSKGVIHRDLKPGNILVESPDSHVEWDSGKLDLRAARMSPVATASGGPLSPSQAAVPSNTQRASRSRLIAQPKILDFGVASVADPDSPAATIEAHAGQIVGTLPYMSPEQLGIGVAATAGQPAGLDSVDTRTDVYALGVVAYELLTGRLPYDIRGKSLTECVRLLSHSEVIRASSTHRHLRGDTDTILLSALEKDPARRYHSPAALADDIRRYLASQPILAKPQTAGYQLRKLIARHTISSALIAAIFLLVIAAAVWMSVLYSRADALRIVAQQETLKTGQALRAKEEQAAIAQRNELASRRVTAVLIDSFRQTDPTLHRTRNVAAKEVFAREILRNGAFRVISDLDDEPTIQASLLNAFGEIYTNIGVFDHAENLLRKCIDVRRRIGESREQVFADALMDLALCRHLDGHTDEAIQHAEEAVGIYTEKLSPEDPSLVRAVSQLGLYYMAMEDLDKAMQAFERAGLTNESTPGHRYGFQAPRLNGIAGVLFARGQTQEAETILRKAIDLALVDSRPDSVMVSSLRNNLGWVLYHRGAIEEGIEQASLALAGRKTTYSETHPKVSDSVLLLGLLTAESGDPLKGEMLLREALKNRLASVPDAKGLIGEAQATLARCLGFLHQCDEAEALAVEGVWNLRQSSGDLHSDTQLAIRFAVELFESCNKPERAEEYRGLLKSHAK